MTNRSFWTAATSSGFVVNRPMSNFMHHNDAETIFDRLEAHGKTWKVYVLEPDPISFTGMIHMARLRDRFATHFVPFSEFERDAAQGTLPNFSLIEPNLLAGHGDYHPAFGRALLPGVEVPIDPPSSILAGEAFLARIYDAIRSARVARPARTSSTRRCSSAGTSRAAPTTTCRPVWSRRRRIPAAAGTRTRPTEPRLRLRPLRLPGPGRHRLAVGGRRASVFTDEYRHTSMIATLREAWDLGPPLTGRDAAARTFHQLFDLAEPRDPDTWPQITALPVPPFQEERVAAGQALSPLGRHLCHGLREHERQRLGTAPPDDPDEEISPAVALEIIHGVAGRIFPLLRRTDPPDPDPARVSGPRTPPAASP